MKTIAFVVCAVAIAACAKPDPSADTAAAAPAASLPPAPVAIKASDIAGHWTVMGKNSTTDSTLVTYDLAATNDTVWTMIFANGQKVPVHVMAVAGDSIVVHSPPYNSVLRKGVRVETTGVLRLQDGKLVGTTVAHYRTKAADSVVTIKMEGTRKP